MTDALAADAVALILAGGNGTRLGELTRWQCKPALSFAGHYRNIDFTLSNCVHSSEGDSACQCSWITMRP